MKQDRWLRIHQAADTGLLDACLRVISAIAVSLFWSILAVAPGCVCRILDCIQSDAWVDQFGPSVWITEYSLDPEQFDKLNKLIQIAILLGSWLGLMLKRLPAEHWHPALFLSTV